MWKGESGGGGDWSLFGGLEVSNAREGRLAHLQKKGENDLSQVGKSLTAEHVAHRKKKKKSRRREKGWHSRGWEVRPVAGREIPSDGGVAVESSTKRGGVQIPPEIRSGEG